MEHIVLGEQRVRVVEDQAELLGFAAVEGAWLEQLYVDPERQQGRVKVAEVVL
jgi:hypothetical protein